jgi:hypothetical protein
MSGRITQVTTPITVTGDSSVSLSGWYVESATTRLTLPSAATTHREEDYNPRNRSEVTINHQQIIVPNSILSHRIALHPHVDSGRGVADQDAVQTDRRICIVIRGG